MSNWYDVSNQSDIDYLNEIYGGFHDACITELRYISGADVDENLIVWADNAGFNPKEIYERNILSEPLTTYIISEKLRWRLFED